MGARRLFRALGNMRLQPFARRSQFPVHCLRLGSERLRSRKLLAAQTRTLYLSSDRRVPLAIRCCRAHLGVSQGHFRAQRRRRGQMFVALHRLLTSAHHIMQTR
eukprot:scaffold187023_cov31-Tisochrysis_lutea.AAC.8